MLSNDISIQTTILPEIDQEEVEAIDAMNKALESNTYHCLKEIEEIYQNKQKSSSINHISYAEPIKGELNIANVFIPEDIEQNKADEINKGLRSKPLAFLFQEDRTTLHNIEKSNIDFSLNYWMLYKNSVDDRFAYLRNAVQVHESHINNIAREFLLKDTPPLLDSKKYQELKSKTREINRVIELLNQYLLESKKEVARDDENKLSLKSIDCDEVISWHLLSRGEKTLIYMFFAVFLYKDKVDIFLLDEPEISLHVKWQRNLIKDLSELAPDNQFIIATHSPSLVQHGWLGHCLEISNN